MNATIIALKSEALKERHWKAMMRELGVVWVMNDLTLGQVWAVDLMKNEGIISGIIITAQVREIDKQTNKQTNKQKLGLSSF